MDKEGGSWPKWRAKEGSPRKRVDRRDAHDEEYDDEQLLSDAADSALRVAGAGSEASEHFSGLGVWRNGRFHYKK